MKLIRRFIAAARARRAATPGCPHCGQRAEHLHAGEMGV